jgi:membrane protein
MDRVELSPRSRLAACRAWWDRSLGGHGLRRIRELDLDTHALALCAQQVLCVAPLIVAVSALLQRTSHHGIAPVMARFFGLHDNSADAVERLFGRSSPSISTQALILGAITAVVFCTSVAAVQQRAFEMIWTLPRVRSIRSYIRQLVWTPALALFCGAMLLTGRSVGHWSDARHPHSGAWSATLLQGVLVFLFYWWTQHWLLGGRVTWRALRPGALAVSVLTTLMVRVSREIVPPQISWQVHAYGLVGGVFVLSVWLMVLSALIFGGVLIGALITERRTDPARACSTDSPLTAEGLDSVGPRAEAVDQELSSM